MPEVTVDDTPLSDEKAVDAILDSLDVPQLPEDPKPRSEEDGPLPPWLENVPLPPWHSDTKRPPDWNRRLGYALVFQTWRENTDVWLNINESASVLRRVVISGLEDEKEAKLLRSEFARHLYVADDARLTHAFVSNLVDEIVATRDRRKYQENFLHVLSDIRNYFKWEDGNLIESSGYIVPISAYKFAPDDVALLRSIYERLPSTLFDRGSLSMWFKENYIGIDEETCPMCGERATHAKKRKSYKKRGEAVRHLDEFNKEYPQELFDMWVRQRVKPGDFTSTTDLYSDYEVWVAEYGANRPEKAEAKRTKLTKSKFSRVMRATNYLFCKRNRANGYRARLKRREQRK